MGVKKFEDIINICKDNKKKVVAVACCHDEDVLKSIDLAHKIGIAEPILIGDLEKSNIIAKGINIDISKYRFIDEKDINKCCEIAVKLINANEADMLMKGLVDTSIILKAVLNKDWGLRKNDVLSHVALFEVESYHKLLLITDAAMNISPDVNTKKNIIKNACMVSESLGIQNPKVAILCAKEKVNPKMKDTVDAKELEDMNKSGIIDGCIVGGPFALDNAISSRASKTKGINHPVAGDADILIAPNIEAGNILYKSLVFFAGAKNAGIIVGAKAPIVLSSRSDNEETKLYSIALAAMASNKN